MIVTFILFTIAMVLFGVAALFTPPPEVRYYNLLGLGLMFLAAAEFSTHLPGVK